MTSRLTRFSTMAVAAIVATSPAVLATPASAAPEGGSDTTAADSTVNASATRYVRVGAANVRSGPGTGYSIVGSRARATKLTGSITRNGWLKIGDRRYVSTDVLTPYRVVGSATRYVKVSRASVRWNPSSRYRVVASRSHGTRLNGALLANGWLMIGNHQFVSPTVLSRYQLKSVTRYVTASDAANVRNRPSTSATVIGSRSRGAKLTGPLTATGWMNIGGSAKYVHPSVISSLPPGSKVVTRYVSASDAANVRNRPSSAGAVVGSVKRGTKVSGSMHNGWLRLGEGRYVSGQVLSTSPPGTSEQPPGRLSGDAILAEGRKYFGIMYRWGGNTPAGFDCSGYTQYVFGRLGVSLPRTVGGQKSVTTRVSTPRKGDLVFWGDGHVAIYAGNGRIYDSGKPGIPVQERRMFSGVTSFGRVSP